MQRHSDVAVLEACARAYGAYCCEGGTAHCQAAPACSRLVDMLVDALTPLLDVFLQHEVPAVGAGRGTPGAGVETRRCRGQAWVCGVSCGVGRPPPRRAPRRPRTLGRSPRRFVVGRLLGVGSANPGTGSWSLGTQGGFSAPLPFTPHLRWGLLSPGSGEVGGVHTWASLSPRGAP